MRKSLYPGLLLLNIVTLVVQTAMAVCISFYEYEIYSVFQADGFFDLLFHGDIDTIFLLCDFAGFVALAIALFVRNIKLIKRDKLVFSDLYYYAVFYFLFNMLILTIRVTDSEGFSALSLVLISPFVFFGTLVLAVIIFFVPLNGDNKNLYIGLSAILAIIALAVCGVGIEAQYIFTFFTCLLILFEQAVMVKISIIEKPTDEDKTSIETENNNSTIK